MFFESHFSLGKEKIISPTFCLLLIPTCLFGYLAIEAFLAPIFEEYYVYSISNYIYRRLSNICHQYPSRSLWILNRPMGLCSRCFAIYASFSFSLFLVPHLNRKRIIIISFFLLPLLVDGLVQYFHIDESNNPRRIFFGVLFGFSASCIYKYLTTYLMDSINSVSERKNIITIRTSVSFLIVVVTNFYALLAVFKA